MASNYTIEGVLAEIHKLNDQIEEIEAEKEIWRVRLKQLQRKCPHTAGYSYKDMSGVGCYHCPTCGYDS